MSLLKRQVSSSSIFMSFFIFMIHNSTVNLKLIYFLLTKFQFWHFWVLWWKLQNSSCHFPSNESVFLQILHHSSMSWKITLFYFLSSNNIYFVQKEPIKVKIFETSECSGQNLSNSLCQSWNNKFIPLQILYPSSFSWKITPLYFFTSNNLYFAQKERIKCEDF